VLVGSKDLVLILVGIKLAHAWRDFRFAIHEFQAPGSRFLIPRSRSDDLNPGLELNLELET